MQLILTHENADFDAIASQLAAGKLYPEASILLPRRVNKNVEQFLMLYWSAFSFIRMEDWKRRKIGKVVLVDTQALNTVRGMVKHPQVQVIDHHLEHERHKSWQYRLEAVGATTTILVEMLQERGISLMPEEATLLLLGIYEDTGSLTYDTTTQRDLAAGAWLLAQHANLTIVRRFLHIPLTPAQLALYDKLHTAVSWHEIRGQSIIITGATADDDYTDEIASIAHRLRESLTPAGLFVLVQLGRDVQLVARSLSDQVDVAAVARALGGGGHERASAARVKNAALGMVKKRIEEMLPEIVQPVVRVADLMSYGVQTVSPDLSIAAAAELMQRYGYEGYPVVDETRGKLVGLLTRRAIDRATSHNLGRLPVSRVMRTGAVTVRPSDSIDHLQQLMLAEGWGQIPVLAEDAPAADGHPIGIVTRTDLLNYLFQPKTKLAEPDMRQLLLDSLDTAVWQMVLAVSEEAAALQLPLYFVGGIVRDMLLGQPPTDLDMVVEGDAIALAQTLKDRFGGEVRSHKRFGTAKWALTPAVWTAVSPQSAADEKLPDSIDFVTARTEFYAKPTALPEVTHGSIKLDLHRRDFTINTLAVRLDGAYLGQLLDFYGGQRDLEEGIIRVLHSLSFVDDPTRILRAARLEQRLDFTIEPRTTELIIDALPLLDRVSGTRIRHELELTFQEPAPIRVMNRLNQLDVFEYIYPGLAWTAETAAIFVRVPRFAADPVWRTALAHGSVEFVYFALWLAPLDPLIQMGVMERLRVRKATREDVSACCQALETVRNLPADARPSVVEKALRPYAPRVLLIVRILLNGRPQAELLDKYYQEWRQVKTAVTGHTLRQMGLKPGPEYSRILDKLRAARLDGEVTDEAEERALLTELISDHQTENPLLSGQER
jgi:tRNA nucleotidyltransferase (CCA-adding enzyme)